MQVLAQTPHLPQLRVLCLGHNRIESAGWASLASSPYLKRLRALHLTLTSLREDGVRALAGSPLLSRLRDLIVGMNQLPPGCLAELVHTHPALWAFATSATK